MNNKYEYKLLREEVASQDAFSQKTHEHIADSMTGKSLLFYYFNKISKKNDILTDFWFENLNIRYYIAENL